MSVILENEHETALNWYEKQLERLQEAKLEANVHLDGRLEESSSGVSSVKLSRTSSARTLSQAAEIRAKITSAEIEAKQLPWRKSEEQRSSKNNWRLKENLSKMKFKGSNLWLKKVERLIGSQGRGYTQTWRRYKMQLITLKLCLIDCLILRMTVWSFFHRLPLVNPYP